MAAALMIAVVFLAAILLEIPEKDLEGQWVVEEEKEAVTPMQAANMGDVAALARLFGAALPFLPGSTPAGEARNAAYDGQTARKVTLTYDAFTVYAVRPAEAAPLLLMDHLDVQLRSDLTAMNLPVTLASREGAYCAYFADSTAAYAIFAPAAEEADFLLLLEKITAVR
ncbi:MAG: hypothetical protein E7329_03750 [Clostridiales bacterium]|nr:hypothetical protein [Clostridiales bacterium]